ncbi:periplasmic solute binding protein [Ectothiorhodospira sp. PHS-1]|uniref:metal ABC transporter solute-binding protein, Zn/Mn family n=1 Tax=Ectothiorhodospira sp. PHS-1 TaxID=519989 RepID=UPI00024A8090|nr:zinc ABC transporter substrate-binding protein [Ectothiorhodospira sp. PHS-1]EHQ53158.1 periplasmic solute binding protein [Ectothiorhodospira sp. PHS-1]
MFRASLLTLLVLLITWTAPVGAREGRVVATFSILGDLVREVAGEDITVDVLTPVGAEVHDWELTPRNFMSLERADIVFYNGLDLEQWMPQVKGTVRNRTPVIAVAEASGFETRPIITGEFAGVPDPHLWMDPRAAAAYGHAIAAALAGEWPERARDFQQRANRLEQRLLTLHEELKQTLADIPPDQRLLITSEAAFVYFAAAYGFEHDGVWGTNAETEGSPRQIMRIVDRVRESRPRTLFWESTISDRHVRSVAADTGVAVAGPLYVDSLGEPGSGAEDYAAMMRHNAALLRRHLGTP